MKKNLIRNTAVGKLLTVSIVVLICQIFNVFSFAQDSRTIGKLFFETDQRRILEGIRQGIIDTDIGDDVLIQPITVPEVQFERLSIIDEVTGERVRPADLTLDGYILNRNTGNIRFSFNGSSSAANNESIAPLGLKVDLVDAENGKKLRVIDALSQSAHPISRGNFINAHGGVDVADRNKRFIFVKRNK